ncbi:MAG: hypothetical protein ACQEQC_08535 [Elusimicrobiota bacterium]
MKIFDLKEEKALPYKDRKKNVLYKSKDFKVRVIDLPPGGKMPQCSMEDHVIFHIIQGTVNITVNKETERVTGGQVLVSEPAKLSMRTEDGVRIMGIQVKKYE